MDKEVFIPEESKVIEQAELLADMKAKQEGFSRNSARWEAAKQKFLTDRYENSSIPHISNPGTPEIPASIYHQFDKIFGNGGFLDKYTGSPAPSDILKYEYTARDEKGHIQKGERRKISAQWKHSKSAKYAERIRKSVTDLINVYAELVLNHEKSSYKFPAGASKRDTQMVVTNQYARYTIATILGTLLSVLYSIDRENIQRLMTTANEIANEKMKRIPRAPGSKPGSDRRIHMLYFTQAVKDLFIKNIQAGD